MSDWKSRAAGPDKDVRQALELAHKELSEIAQTTGLSPDGEKARDLCHDALQKMDQKMNKGARRSGGF